MRSRYFVSICIILLKRWLDVFCTSSMILLKVVVVCFGVVLCSEVDNVVLHALPTPRGSLSPEVSKKFSRLILCGYCFSSDIRNAPITFYLPLCVSILM